MAQQSADEKAVWKLEHSYWEYVKSQDVASYKELWHDNFVGWPSFSAQPQRKDHITDWLTSYTARGSRLKSYELKPAASQATGQLVVVHYWVTTVWAKKDGSEQTEARRITHTWLRGDKGWQIISGMSAAAPEAEK
jgi:ketosteroid isomerase-like protein